MRNHFINYTTVGVFVAAMIVALLWALAQISGRTGPSDGYAIVMDAVTDIDYGTLVRYEGYKIGQVERIAPEWVNGKYQFRVIVSVEKDWKFPVNSIARISASSFLAGKTVEVFSGKSTQLVAVGGEIPSGPPADAFSLMAQVAGQIGDLSENSLKPLISPCRRDHPQDRQQHRRQPGRAVHQPAGDRRGGPEQDPEDHRRHLHLHHPDERDPAAGRQVPGRPEPPVGARDPQQHRKGHQGRQRRGGRGQGAERKAAESGRPGERHDRRQPQERR